MAMFDGFSAEDFQKAIEANPEAWGKALTSGLNNGSPAGNPGFSQSDTGGGMIWTEEGEATQADKDQFANWSNAQTGGNMTGDFETQTLQEQYQQKMADNPDMKYSDAFMKVADGTDTYLGQSYQKSIGQDNRSPNGGLPADTAVDLDFGVGMSTKKAQEQQIQQNAKTEANATIPVEESNLNATPNQGMLAQSAGTELPQDFLADYYNTGDGKGMFEEDSAAVDAANATPNEAVPVEESNLSPTATPEEEVVTSGAQGVEGGTPLDEFLVFVQEANGNYQTELDRIARSGQYDRGSQIEDASSHFASEQTDLIMAEMERLGITHDMLQHSVSGSSNDGYRDLGVANQTAYGRDFMNMVNNGDYGGTNPRDIAAQPATETIFTNDQLGDFTLQEVPDSSVFDDPFVGMIAGALAPITGGWSVVALQAAKAITGETLHAGNYASAVGAMAGQITDVLVSQGLPLEYAEQVTKAISAGSDAVGQSEDENGDIVWQPVDVSDILGDVQVQVPDFEGPVKEEDDGGGGSTTDSSTEDSSSSSTESPPTNPSPNNPPESGSSGGEDLSDDWVWSDVNQDEEDVFGDDFEAPPEIGEDTDTELGPDDPAWWKDILAGIVPDKNGNMPSDDPFGDTTDDESDGLDGDDDVIESETTGDDTDGTTDADGTTGDTTTGDVTDDTGTTTDTGTGTTGTNTDEEVVDETGAEGENPDDNVEGGPGPGTGPGDGDGEGEGEGEGDGGQVGKPFASGGGGTEAEWTELFPYTKITPLQKKKLLPMVKYIKQARGMV